MWDTLAVMSDKRAAKQARRARRKTTSTPAPRVHVTGPLIVGEDLSVEDMVFRMAGRYSPDPTRTETEIADARRAFNEAKGNEEDERSIEMLREDFARYGRDGDRALIAEYESVLGG
jgi:hypothetical protein